MKTKLLNENEKIAVSKINNWFETVDFTLTNKLWLLVIGIIFSNSSLIAQQNNGISPFTIFEQVVPNAYASTSAGTSFTGPFANSPRTYQILIAASELTSLTGKHLVSLSFRNSGTITTDWPASNTTYNNYDIYLSGSVNPADRSFTFAQNVVGTQTLVRSGSLTVPAGALTIGSNPNNFSYDIVFTTPWFYAGGNLLVEIRHDGSSGTSRSVDAAGTSSPGYASLYSACWESGYTPTSTTKQGNFVSVNFKADDALKVEEFNKNELSVFPNPTSEKLYIESQIPVSNVKLFNMLGQMVLNQDLNVQKGEISLSQLSIGTYLLHVESEFGTEIRKIVKK
jgi:hypothetical protein